MFNETIIGIEPSRSVTLLAKTKELQKVDPEIVNLTGGEPDFDMPKRICDEITRQMAAGFTHYTDSKGIPDLRERIAKKLAEDNNAPFAADNILVTPGAKLAVYLAVRSVINPGDEAIWLAPGWVSYPAMIEVSGGTPVCLHLDYDDDYRIRLEDLEALTNEKTKLLIINYPNNPTGKILTDNDIESLSQYMRNHPDIYILSDEIYEKVVFDGNKIISMASFPEFRERVVIVNGFSKCSAMTGARLGYLACNPDLYRVVLKLFQHTMSCVSGFIQKGGVVALDCTEETEMMRQSYEKRRNMLVEGINAIDGVEFVSPAGAFYAWVRFDTDIDNETLCTKLLEEAKIAGVPGIAYGEEKANCVRFSFASSEEALQSMLDRLKDFVKTL